MYIVIYIVYDKDCNYVEYSRGSYWSIFKLFVLFFFNKNFVGNKKYIFFRIDIFKNVFKLFINRL